MLDVRLTVAGRVYDGWTGVRIERGMDRIAGAFELAVSDRWTGKPKAAAIRPGDACTLSVGDEVLITGFVDEVAIDYDSQRHSIRVRGRDATGDLVDCAAVIRQWQGRTLAWLAGEVCKPFGVRVTDKIGDDTAFRRLKTEPGETAFELLERAARIRGVLLVSDSQGGLVITRAGTERVPTELVLGENILDASGAFSHVGRFSEYQVLGQQPGGDFLAGDEAAQVLATSWDSRIRRHRPTVLVAEDPVDRQAANVRAEWQRNVAFGRSQSVRVTVAGLQHEDGLWQPNRLVYIRDDFLSLDAWWLIVSVTSMLNGAGSRSLLTLMPPEAFDRRPLPEQEDADAWAA